MNAYISSEAGDGINGKGFPDLDTAKLAVEAVYPSGDWDEVPGESTSGENAWEYAIGEGEPVARIEFA